MKTNGRSPLKTKTTALDPTPVLPAPSSAIVPVEAGSLITNGIDETRATVQKNLRTMVGHVRTAVAVELAETEAIVQESVIADIETRMTGLNQELGQHRTNPARLPSLRRRATFLQGQLAGLFRQMQPLPESSQAETEANRLAAEAIAHYLPNLAC